MSKNLTQEAKEIIALEIIESTSKAFFAYFATLDGFTPNGRPLTLSEAYKSFAADVWVHVIEELARERARKGGR